MARVYTFTFLIGEEASVDAEFWRLSKIFDDGFEAKGYALGMLEARLNELSNGVDSSVIIQVKDEDGDIPEPDTDIQKPIEQFGDFFGEWNLEWSSEAEPYELVYSWEQREPG